MRSSEDSANAALGKTVHSKLPDTDLSSVRRVELGMDFDLMIGRLIQVATLYDKSGLCVLGGASRSSS